MAGLDALNAMDDSTAEAALRGCCGASRWIQAMLRARPFATVEALEQASASAWASLGPPDWREAIAHHPRLGAAREVAASGTAAWSRQEQSGVDRAPADVRAALVREQADYEARFGFLFLLCATGKPAEAMLAALRARMHNDPAAELRVAAAELEKITRLRLAKLVQA